MSKGSVELGQAGTDPQIYYLHVRFSVLRENHRPFVALMERLLSVIHDLYGWEFVHGSYPISGKVNRFVHVWKIPNPVDVLHIMRHGAFNEKAVDAAAHVKNGQNSEEYKYFRAIYWELQGLITETTHLLTTALPADPNYEGYQSQTILIDRGEGKPQWYLLDHEDMKEEWKGKDIRECVDAQQFFERRGRWAQEAPPKKVNKPKDPFANHARWASDEDYRLLMGRLQQSEAEAVKVGDPAKRPKDEFGPFKGDDVDWKAISNIRELLNFGVTHASVESPLKSAKGGGKTSTLVNLSALKPRSVQQEGYLPPSTARAPLKAGPLKEGTSVDNLLIVAPWGSIYCVDHKDVAKVAKTVNFPAATAGNKKKTTDQRVAAFTDGQVPLGTVLEPRAGQIGDGCACYVINLNAIPGPPTAKKAVASRGATRGKTRP